MYSTFLLGQSSKMQVNQKVKEWIRLIRTHYTQQNPYPVTTIYDESALWCCQKQEKIGRRK